MHDPSCSLVPETNVSEDFWLGGGFKHFLFSSRAALTQPVADVWREKSFLSSPLLGEMIPFDEHIFQMG